MKKLSLSIGSVVSCIFLFFGCNTKEIRLITNVEYDMVTSHQADGFVKDPLETKVTVVPQKVLPEFEYYVAYEVTEGEGYIITETEEVILEDEGVLLDPEQEFSVTWLYVGTVAGTHSVLLKTYDNFEKSKVETLVYTINNVNVLWQAQSAVAEAKVNDTIPFSLEVVNQTAERVVSFEYLPTITTGQGKFLDGAKNVLSSKVTAISQGKTELYFVPTTTGATVLTFDLVDSNGQEKTTSLALNILEETQNVPPVAVARIKDEGSNKGVAPFTVSFDGSEAADTDGTIASYLWDFGVDDATSALSEPTYTFDTVEEYTVRLTVTDNEGDTHSNTLIIIVEAVMDTDFMAVDDLATTDTGIPVNIDVVENDQIAAGITATVDAVGIPLNGTAVLETDGSVTYTANVNFNGNDAFTYIISNGLGGTSTAQVVVRVTVPNSPPIAKDDLSSTPENTPVTIEVLVNDEDPEGDVLQVIAVDVQATGGTAVINADFTITYTPATDFVGEETFTYTISDSAANETEATVTVTVTDLDQHPVAVDDAEGTPYNTATTIKVLENDEDPEGQPLILQSVATPINGTAIIDGNEILYTPNVDFSGEEIFTYVIEDAAGNTDEGEILVTVGARERVPISQSFEAFLNHKAIVIGEIDGFVFKDEVAAITRLDLEEPDNENGGNPNVGDLYGIEHFTSLERFTSYGHSFPILDFSGNPKLEYISISEGGSATINLSKNALLKYLSIDQTPITAIDLSRNPLLDFLLLEMNGGTLDLSANTTITNLALSDISFPIVGFGELKSLESLSFADSDLSTLDVSMMDSLTRLWVGNRRNPNLTCIQVSDIAAANLYTSAGDWIKDAVMYYSLDCTTQRERIYVPDDNFEQFLIDKGLDSGPIDNYIFKDMVVNETSFFFDGEDIAVSRYITNFTGIEAFESLLSFRLDFINDALLDLSANTKLTNVRIKESGIKEIDLQSNTALQNVSITTTALQDITLPITNNITDLNLGYNALTSLDISNISNTATLEVQDNSSLNCIKVANVAEANANTSTGQWIKDDNAYYDLDCDEIRERIYVPDDNFENWLIANGYDSGTPDNYFFKDNVAGVTDFWYTNEDELVPDVFDFTGIEAFENLLTLNIEYTDFTTIDLSGNTKLTRIEFNNTYNLAIINITKNTALTHFEMDTANVKNIDVSQNKLLKYLDIDGGLEELDLINNTLLETLDIDLGSSMATLDISNNNELTRLALSGAFGLTCIKVNNVADAIARMPNQYNLMFSTTCP